MFKKSIRLLAILLMAMFMFSACSETSPADKPKEPEKKTEQSSEQKPTEKQPDSTSAPAADKQLTIGVSINALTAIHNRKVFEATEKWIKEMGHKPVMVNANGIAVQQVSDIENLIQQKVNCIIIQNGDTDALRNVVQQAKDAGIPTVSMESGWIPGISTMFAKNDFEIGAQLYTKLAAEMGYEGEVITVYHNEHPAVRTRGLVQEAVLKEYTGIKRVATITSGYPGTVEIVYKGIESALQAHPNVKQVWCAFDLEALGAAQAIKALGKTNIITAGVDGELDALKMIKEGGPIVATVVSDLNACAKQGVEVAIKLARGEEVSKFYAIDSVVVTKENVDEYLQ